MAVLFLAAPVAALAQNATTTTLTVAPTAAPYGSAFRMTAAVTVSGSTTHSLRGSVTFTDTVSGTAHVVGTAQVQTTGVAVLEQSLGIIGSHSITAVFSANKYFLTSSSNAQLVRVTGTYPTTTSLVKTGGTPGSWSLSATVVGLGSPTLDPTSTVSLFDTSNGNYLLSTASLGTGVVARQTVGGPNSPVGVGRGPSRVVTGDFNGDGYPDLAVLNSTDGTVSILLGNGAGAFNTTGTTYAAGLNPLGLAISDLNGDGRLDLVVANQATPYFSVLLGNGDGTFAAHGTGATSPTGQSATAVGVGDFNGDGIPDVAVTSLGAGNLGQVYIYLGDGAGNFAASTTVAFSVGIYPENIVVADFNGDGNLDLATANFSDSTVTVLQGDGTGKAFTSSTINLPTASNPYGIAAADFNGDGKTDLAVTETATGNVAVLQGNGNGTFGSPANFATGTTPGIVISGDFNGDGIRDLAVSNFNGSSVTFLIGTGTGNFQVPPQTVATGANPLGLATGDFDGDGNGDLAVANDGAASVTVLLNQITDTSVAAFNLVTVPGSGNHNVDAMYGGDANFSLSAPSNTVSLGATPQPTTTLLSASANSSTVGQQISFTATVSPNQVGTLTTNGDTVTFKDNGNVIGTATVTNGVAVLNYVENTAGNHSIVATFNGDANFQTSTSAQSITIHVTAQHAVVTWPQPSPISYGTILWTPQLNATATDGGITVNGTLVYTTDTGVAAPGAILPVGTHTLTVVFTPTDKSYTVTQTTSIVVSQANPALTWPLPVPIWYGTPLTGIQLNATATGTVQIQLSGIYNTYGVYTNGTSFTTGGFDHSGNAYSANALGSAIVWNGVTYTLGPVNAPDAISNVTTPIPTPAGYYIGLQVLGAMVNNSHTDYVFTINYSDGTSVPTTINMSDWVYPQGFTPESVIKCNIARNNGSGSPDGHSTCVYGYTVPIDPKKIVTSILIPQDQNASFLALGLTTPPVAGTFLYSPASGAVLQAGNQTLSTVFTPNDTVDYTSPAKASVPLLVNQATTTLNWAQPAPIQYGTPLSSTQLNAVPTVNMGMVIPPISQFYRVSAIFSDGQTFSVNGFGNTGQAYSADLLPPAILWNGTSFPLGPINLPNALTSATVTMPQGSFYSLYLLAAGNGAQAGQTFSINYTDGTSTTAQLSISGWTTGAQYGESVATSTAYLNTQSGTHNNTVNYIYGYQIPLNSAKTLQSVTLPNNQNVVVMSMALSTSANPAITVPGTTTYNPPAGTILPVGVNEPLAASFTPTDTQDYSKATATTTITVTQNTGDAVTLTSSNNPAFPGSSITFTATLPNVPGGATAPTGSVVFYDNGAQIGTGTVSTTGGVPSATFTTSSLAIGTHPITAKYSGDPNYAAATSSQLNQVVGKGTATVTPKGAPNPSAYTTSVIITITVTGVNNVAPTGSVTLTYNGTPLGGTLALTPGSNGTSTATYTTNILPVGSDNIVATYGGDTNYN